VTYTETDRFTIPDRGIVIITTSKGYMPALNKPIEIDGTEYLVKGVENDLTYDPWKKGNPLAILTDKN